MEVLLFGDVFLYQGTEHVFLVDAGEVWYAAKIISKFHTSAVKRDYEKEALRNKAGTEQRPLYCFVELQTSEFKGRAAHLHRSQKAGYFETPKPLKTELSDEDKKAIRDLIITRKSPVYIGLRDRVKKLKFDF